MLVPHMSFHECKILICHNFFEHMRAMCTLLVLVKTVSISMDPYSIDRFHRSMMPTLSSTPRLWIVSVSSGTLLKQAGSRPFCLGCGGEWSRRQTPGLVTHGGRPPFSLSPISCLVPNIQSLTEAGKTPRQFLQPF